METRERKINPINHWQSRKKRKRKSAYLSTELETQSLPQSLFFWIKYMKNESVPGLPDTQWVILANHRQRVMQICEPAIRETHVLVTNTKQNSRNPLWVFCCNLNLLVCVVGLLACKPNRNFFKKIVKPSVFTSTAITAPSL